MAKRTIQSLGESDYKKMGMEDINLFVLYPTFQHVCALPGVLGACVSLLGTAVTPARVKVQSVAEHRLGPLYLGFYCLKFCYLFINANLGTRRRPTGVNVPDQHIYKVVTGSNEGAIVLMDDKHELYGPFNRAQRALQNLNESIALLIVDALLVGYVFPSTTGLFLAAFSACRVKSAMDYTHDREKRVFFGMMANFIASSLGGMALVIGILCVYLQLMA
mmetsp:Transcript_30090/g.70153  ORF Transcript_30090/g.70153 Transcript_30090/m.70153 type:complete len:219 (+) Transcript_30090:120-776(+)